MFVQVHGGTFDVGRARGRCSRRRVLGADGVATGRGARSAAGRQYRVAVAGHRHRGGGGGQLDGGPEEGQRAGGHAVAEAGRAGADGQARRAGGRPRVRRVRQGHDGGQVRRLDAQGAARDRRMRARAQGSRVPGRPVQVSG